MSTANASALHIIMSPSVNTYSVEKRNSLTLIRSKNGTQLSFSQNMLSGRSCHYVFHRLTSRRPYDINSDEVL